MRIVYKHYNPINAIFSVIPEFPKYSKIQDILFFWPIAFPYNQTCACHHSEWPIWSGYHDFWKLQASPVFSNVPLFLGFHDISAIFGTMDIVECPVLSIYHDSVEAPAPLGFSESPVLPGVHEILGVLGTPDFSNVLFSLDIMMFWKFRIPLFFHMSRFPTTHQKKDFSGGTNCIAYINPRHLQNAFDREGWPRETKNIILMPTTSIKQ